jgi:hypothetical protein
MEGARVCLFSGGHIQQTDENDIYVDVTDNKDPQD